MYQYSNITPRLSGQTSICGGVFFVSKSLLGILKDKRNFKNVQFWPERLGAMFEYIERWLLLTLGHCVWKMWNLDTGKIFEWSAYWNHKITPHWNGRVARYTRIGTTHLIASSFLHKPYGSWKNGWWTAYHWGKLESILVNDLCESWNNGSQVVHMSWWTTYHRILRFGAFTFLERGTYRVCARSRNKK